MIKFRKWIYLAIFLIGFYYIFIVNIFVTLSVVAALYVALRLYKVYARHKLNKLSGSKALFRESSLGHFIALVAKVAKADGRVSELEAQLIGMMFDDISKIFIEKEKTRSILKEIFNEEKQKDDTKEVAQSLNKLLGRSILKRRQFVEFLIQLAFVDDGLSSDEDKVLRVIVTELNIALSDYEAILHKFENMTKSQPQTMSMEEAYKTLGVHPNDDFNTIKKTYRNLVREYHPDIMIAQEKDAAYIEEATAKMQEINQAYQVIKEAKK
ncbi:TerB family tellurite resistance protein [Sulfurovum sp.]|uniref:TerB family tellurite resistance protein n=1 Tax=Sulfurovum sp. TaxID=1969726 RepID=UPI002867D03E|nr:TerB family tellurite resistance protein [Sulfurovum sp.]